MVVIQGKLDGIKTKYAEISSMSDNVLKTLERTLSLSSQLQHTHEDLSSWLEKTEAEISAFAGQEPVGEQLIHAQSRQKVSLLSFLFQRLKRKKKEKTNTYKTHTNMNPIIIV